MKPTRDSGSVHPAFSFWPALAAGLLLSALVLIAPTRPARPGQPVGWALRNDLDPGIEVLRLGLVAFLPLATVWAARWFRRGSRSRVGPDGGATARTPPRDAAATGGPRRRARVRVPALLAVTAPAVLLAGLSAVLFSSTPPNLDLFEHGHSLFPLQVYLSGGRPYRDAIPGHGLLADGGLQWIAARTRGESVAAIQSVESAFGLLFWPATFLLALSATRRAGLSLAAVPLLYFHLPQSGFPRAIPALLALAIAIAAMRSRRRGIWFAAGVSAALAAAFSIEFGLYAACAGLAAGLLSRGRRTGNLAVFAAGGGLVALLGLAAAWAAGALSQTIQVHSQLLPALFPVYAFGLRTVLSPPWWADSGKPLFLAGLFAAAGALGMAAARWPRPGAALRSAIPLAVFFLATSLSVVQRHHFAYPLLVLPAMAALSLRATRRMRWANRAAVLSAATLLLLLARPGLVLAGTLARLGPAQVPTGWVRLQEPPRAAGVFLRVEDARLVDAMRSFISEGGLPPGKTWLDLSNAPALYYLFAHRPPIRHYEVPFLQPEAARADAIAALESDPRVAAVLVASGERVAERIDGIDNRDRVPDVWSAVARCYEPGFERSGIEIWVRRTEGCRDLQADRRVLRSAGRPSNR